MSDSFDLSETVNTVYNNWTSQNTATVVSWKNNVAKTIFIFEIVHEKYKYMLDNTLLASLILSTLSTIVAAVSSTIIVSNSSHELIVFWLNVVIFTIGGATTVLNGVVKLYRWDELVSDISTFIEKLDVFHVVLTSELLLPDNLRSDAVEFIKHKNTEYSTIMKHVPNIRKSDYDTSYKKYVEFIENSTVDNKYNFTHLQKFEAVKIYT